MNGRVIWGVALLGIGVVMILMSETHTVGWITSAIGVFRIVQGLSK